MTDADGISDLLQAVALRDRAAFRTLYDKTAGRMNAIALKILGRSDLAEDVLQEAYISVWDRAGNYCPEHGHGLAWMATIVRRRAIDRLRASPWLNREVPHLEEINAYVSTLPETLTLRRCLERLDEKTQCAIVLAYVYGMTHAELHDRTGLPLGTIKSRLRRGLNAIKICMDA